MYSHPGGGVLRLQAVLNNRKYKSSQMPVSQQQATTTSPAQQSPGAQRQVSSLSANPQSPGAQQKAPDSPLLKIAPLPKQSQIDPVHNNAPSSSANGQYPYQPQQQRAAEPVTTNTSGAKSSQPVPANSGIARLESMLPQSDNSANLQIPQQLGYLPINYQEMVEYTQEQEDKNFSRDTAYAGIARLGAAISGAETRFQEWWR
jgi:hypothetical protein